MPTAFPPPPASASTSSRSPAAAATVEERLGRALAARLSAGSAELPHDIGERLRAAREQALAVHKRERGNPAVSVDAGGRATAGATGWWPWFASAVPLVALVAGLVLIADRQADERAAQIAEVDAELLTDELPTAAYTDPGFAQFIKTNHVPH